MLVHSPTIYDDICPGNIFLDTTVFINCSDSSEFLEFIKSLSDKDCLLWTIPSVKFEFARYANTINEYNEFINFIKDLGVTVFNRIEEIVLDKSDAFTVALNKAQSNNKKRMSYTDAVLCSLAFKHRSSAGYIMTSNHNDIPPALYDRKEIITFEISGHIRNEALYQLSESKLSTILNNL